MTRRRDDSPTDAEIDRSQALLGAILGEPPPVSRVERAARALAQTRDLQWDLMKPDWQAEHLRQATAMLEAADHEPLTEEEPK